MNVKSRRFSLDSAVSLDGGSALHGRRSSSRLSSKKVGQCRSLDDARLEIQELNHSLEDSRENTITEESSERSDDIINTNSFRKHNRNFHKLFPEVPDEETLTHTFTCALQKEVPYHGKLFVSDRYVCFYSSVLLKDTKVVMTACSVSGVKKHNSALSMLSVQTADGEKFTFVSLRNREMCYRRLQSICWAQGKCTDSSPHLSSAENEADPDLGSSYSSLEDSVDHSLSRQNSICLDNSFSLMSSEAPTRRNSTRANSSTDDDTGAGSWIRRITDGVQVTNISLLFYTYIMLLLLLLLVSGYIGLRIVALEEQLTGLSLQHREYRQT